MKKLLIVMACLVFLAACTQGAGPQGDVVATIDSTKITTKDIDKELSALPEFAREFFKGPEGANKLVDEVVKKELLYLEAKKRGLDKDEELLRRLEDAKKNAVIGKLLEAEIKNLPKVGDKEIREYYDAHKDEFMNPQQVRISQIVVKSEEDAKKVYDRLQKGDAFNKVASELSTDKSSAANGGDMGFFKKADMNPALANVAFRLKKGQVSMPLPLKDGIHIIAVSDVKGVAKGFDEVKDVLAQQLAAKQQQDRLEKFVEDLRKTFKVEINKDNIAKIGAAPAQPVVPGKPAEKPADKPQEKPAEKAEPKK
jgi:peptidyl-prolyl cis-trans isomerase C